MCALLITHTSGAIGIILKNNARVSSSDLKLKIDGGGTLLVLCPPSPGLPGELFDRVTTDPVGDVGGETSGGGNSHLRLLIIIKFEVLSEQVKQASRSGVFTGPFKLRVCVCVLPALRDTRPVTQLVTDVA